LRKLLQRRHIREGYFSQHAQDKWIVEDIYDKAREGYFVELAGGNGVLISNTYILETEYKWKGICIEANSTLFEDLVRKRTCICDPSCVDGIVQDVKFTHTGMHSPDMLMCGIVDKDTANTKSDEFEIKRTVTL